jgi:flagellar basal body-associated protein FliL
VYIPATVGEGSIMVMFIVVIVVVMMGAGLVLVIRGAGTAAEDASYPGSGADSDDSVSRAVRLNNSGSYF